MSISVIKNASIYVLPSFFSAGVGFILLPILTRFLSPGEYGVLANFNALLAILTILVGFSLPGAIKVRYFHSPKNEIPEYIANSLILLLLSSVVVGFSLYVFFGLIVDRLGLSLEWALLAVVISGCKVVTMINLSIWQATQTPKPYAVFETISLTLNISLSLLFVVALCWGWQGRVLGTGITFICLSFTSVLILARKQYLSFRLNWDHMKDALSFGIPLIPHQLSFWLKTGIDRFILTLMVSTAATGLYNVSFQLGSVLLMLFTAFSQAWSPHLYSQLKNIHDSQKIKLVRLTYLFFAVALILAAVTTLAIPPFLTLILGPKYKGVEDYIGYICFGFAFHGMYLIVCSYVFYVKRTLQLSMVTFTTGVFHVITCYFFVEVNGAIGAAQAFTISSFLTFICVWWLSAKVYRMPWLSFRAC